MPWLENTTNGAKRFPTGEVLPARRVSDEVGDDHIARNQPWIGGQIASGQIAVHATDPRAPEPEPVADTPLTRDDVRNMPDSEVDERLQAKGYAPTGSRRQRRYQLNQILFGPGAE